MNIHDVANEARVSVATVSRVFNLPDKVTVATRERVMRVAGSLGYVPNTSARTLRTQRSRVIGVVLPTLVNPVFAECLDGISRAALASGYAIQPLFTQYQLDLENQAVSQLLAANVDGIILAVSNPPDSSALKRLNIAGMPYVLAYNRHPDYPCVSVDSEQAVVELIARLVSLGHRRIAMVTGKLNASDRAQQRCNGYRRGMKEARCKHIQVLEVPFIEAAVTEISAMLSSDTPPTALVCSNDLLAIRSLRAAHLAGLSVPQQLSVVGFDGIAMGEDLTPALSSIIQNNVEIGQSSVELLVDSLNSGATLTSSASRTLPHAFRAGESCACITST